MPKVAVVCHDAGGAELISNWIANSDNISFSYHLAGPAKKIFKNNLGWDNNNSLSELISECDSLLCGTGWQSDLEKKAIKEFKDLGKKTIAFLDHWVNYKERFQLGDELILPEEIWVADDYAKNIAKKCFPDTTIKRKSNAYFIKLKNEFLVRKTPSSQNKKVLYICEPIKEHALLEKGDERYWGYTEEDALQFFLNNLSNIDADIDSIVIRPHPSEDIEKYKWALEKTKLNISISSKNTLAEDILCSHIVVGCESMAMVVALLADKLVISCIPPGGRACQLPHKEILDLKDMVFKQI